MVPSTQGVIADHHERGADADAARVAERVGDQPPDLSLKDGFFIKTEHVIQGVAGIDHVHQRQSSRAQGNVEHQIGDTLVPIPKAKSVEPTFQFLHRIHLKLGLGLFYQLGGEMSRANYEHSMKV